MKKRKAYRIPPPKDPDAPPSGIAVQNLEKSLREAAGAYYDAYPQKTATAGTKSWWNKNRPGIVRRFKDKFLPPDPRKKKLVT